MKNIFKAIIVFIITLEAKIILKKYKPFIIAVTGSVGKTSTKDAVFSIVSKKFYTRKSDKSFNSELGVPLTVLGCPNAWSHPIGWLKNISHGFEQILFSTDYPTHLVLEIGADRPRDIKNLMKWIHPDISIITKISKVPVHVEAFKSPEEVAKEKMELAKGLKPGGILILNSDDEIVKDIKNDKASKTIFYGLSDNAEIKISDIKNEMTGVSAKINNLDINIKGVLGIQHIYTCGPAIATGLSLNIPIEECIKLLEKQIHPKGRMNILKGIKNALLIDDTYNSSPDAVYAALDVLKNFSNRKVAILGDMLELGKYAENEHEKVGEYAKLCANKVITVGLRARSMKGEEHFNSSSDASLKIKDLIEENDIVLIKGSQGIRMEKIVKELLDPSLDSANVLVRQESEWLKK